MKTATPRPWTKGEDRALHAAAKRARKSGEPFWTAVVTDRKVRKLGRSDAAVKFRATTMLGIRAGGVVEVKGRNGNGKHMEPPFIDAEQQAYEAQAKGERSYLAVKFIETCGLNFHLGRAVESIVVGTETELEEARWHIERELMAREK